MKFADSAIGFVGGGQSDESEIIRVWTMGAHRCSFTKGRSSVLFVDVGRLLIDSHNKVLEQYVNNVLLSDVGRKSANEDNSTSRLRELWIVEEGVLDVLFKFFDTWEVAFAADANDQCRRRGLGTDAPSR